MRRLGLMTLLLAVGPPSEAWAEGERVVVIEARAADADLARQVARSLAARLSAEGATARVAVAPSPAAPLAPRIDRALSAYARLDPRAAAEELDALLAEAGRTGAEGLSREELVRALLVRAMAALATGDEAALSHAIDRVLAIEPALEPDPAEYPPTLRDALAARRAARTDARHRVILRGLPDDASVFVDAAPVTGEAHALPPGVHLLRVVAPGRTPFALELDVREDHALAVALPPDPEAVLATLAPDPDLATRSARELDVGLVTLRLIARDGGWDLSARDATTARAARVALPSPSEIDAAAAELARALLAPAPTAAPATPARDDGPPWIWIAAGGAAAVVVAALSIWLVTSAESETGRWSR